jgi:ferritin-like metal-binding protein YciE
MGFGTLEELLEEQLKNIYSAETQLVKAIPKLAKKVSSEELKSSLEQHLTETENQVKRL